MGEITANVCSVDCGAYQEIVDSEIEETIEHACEDSSENHPASNIEND